MTNMFSRLAVVAAVLTPVIAYGIGLQICRSFYAKPPLPRAYVEDGLVHYWDAEFNVSRVSHADTNVWVDLVGDKNLSLLPNDLVKFTAHSAKFGYSSYWEPARDSGMFVCDASIPADEIKTVEVCALFSKGIGFPSIGDCNVMFSNGATMKGDMSSTLGDKYCTAPYYMALTRAASATYLGGIARRSSGRYVGYTSWNKSDSDSEGQGATFQDYIARGFTVSGCVTNSADIGGVYSSRFWIPDSLVRYWGSSKPIVYTNNYVYTYGISSPYYTQTDPVGTGLSIGGVRFNGSQYSLFYGYIYAIRVYNRRLDMREREHNADIDYKAFEGKKE